MAGNYKLTYNVDIVLCIDATGSMSDLIDTVRHNAINFSSDLRESMRQKDKIINDLRMRIIAFRDYEEYDAEIARGEEGNPPMLGTYFYNLPDESEDFKEALDSIEAVAGGDEPEDGLEALAIAMNSDWTEDGDKRRHIIILWTDASSHPIGYARGSSKYPNNLPRDWSELTELWESMNESAKRLIMYAPDEPYWSNISSSWENVIHFESEAGAGLKELEYEEILRAISNTV